MPVASSGDVSFDLRHPQDTRMGADIVIGVEDILDVFVVRILNEPIQLILSSSLIRSGQAGHSRAQRITDTSVIIDLEIHTPGQLTLSVNANMTLNHGLCQARIGGSVDNLQLLIDSLDSETLICHFTLPLSSEVQSTWIFRKNTKPHFSIVAQITYKVNSIFIFFTNFTKINFLNLNTTPFY